jgi:hypothetical protein
MSDPLPDPGRGTLKSHLEETRMPEDPLDKGNEWPEQQAISRDCLRRCRPVLRPCPIVPLTEKDCAKSRFVPGRERVDAGEP